ncbi:C1q-like domain-containing protein [Leeuwenhoekiella sp. LLG6367-2.1]|uniref:C1q-like domain-containing protein n=1 Tax=Leeuwenhoekiella sp. LLG6367-2.1 TaxID=3160833 RepID=UPI00386BC40E
MHKFLIVLYLFSSAAYSQIGIGTVTPHPDVILDVNGALRVRNYSEGNDSAAKDSLVVFDGRGVLQRISTKKLLSNIDKSLVKAKLTTNQSISVASYITIVFNSEDFDLKNEFNTATGVFSAKDPGIYRVSAQIKTAGLSAGDLGLAVYKSDAGGSNLIKIAEERFVNFSVLGINVSPPTRSVSTLIELSAGEEISFKLYTLVGISLAGSPSGFDSFCAIEQVH